MQFAFETLGHLMKKMRQVVVEVEVEVEHMVVVVVVWVVKKVEVIDLGMKIEKVILALIFCPCSFANVDSRCTTTMQLLTNKSK